MSSQERPDPDLGAVAVTLPSQDLAIRLDRQGTILDISAAPAARELDGARSLIGRRIQDTQLQDVAARLADALAQVTREHAILTTEYSVPGPAGETHHEARLVPLGGQETLVLLRDITERRLTEKALRESDAQFHHLADNITDAFWIRSPDMKEIHYVSPAFERIWGRPRNTLYGNPGQWVDFIVPEDREHVLRAFASLAAEARSLDIEYRIVRPDGELRWVRVRGFQVRDAQDRLIRQTGIVTDITGRKRAQAELDAAHARLLEASHQAGMAEIATNVLHNVGNILNSVTVSAGLLRATLRTSRAQGLARGVQMMNQHTADLGEFLSHDDKGRLLPGYLEAIVQALLQEQREMAEELEHLTRSIDHIRDVITTQQSHALAGGALVAGRITDLVEDALRMTAETLARDQIWVVTQFEPVPQAMLDRTRVLQVLVNLIRNARNALEGLPLESRRITVRVEQGAGSRLRVTVKDDGAGILAENLQRIFTHGFTTRARGHGFGLHSCAQAAAQMGGTLTAASDGPGRGATFTLELPLDAFGETQ